MATLEEDETRRRFAFGDNWRRYIEHVDDAKVAIAQSAINGLLDVDLGGRAFLDVGCGSGLSSLAAVRAGARVHSFDFDPSSVDAASEVRRRFAPNSRWVIERGDILDARYVERLGRWEVVYSWGVLHHTGAMWQACENVTRLVAPDGHLFIALYNDQGSRSKMWHALKRLYVSVPPLRPILLAITWTVAWGGTFLYEARTRRDPMRTWREYGRERGMSAWHDLVDWAGGYPFEVASPRAVIEFFEGRGFRLCASNLVGDGRGCNEFVFRCDATDADGAAE